MGGIQRIIDNGAGGIVTKSIGLESRKGYLNPTTIELEHGILNAMGLPNPGIQAFTHELQNLLPASVPIIGSIYGKNTQEFQNLAQQMQATGVHALELNLSCPHAKHVGLETGCDPVLIQRIVASVKSVAGIPVFVKLSPNVTDLPQLVQAAEQGGADGIVLINTVKAMAIDIETQRPILSNKHGGYSGKAIKPIGIRCVYDAYEATDLPIIGVGGITTGLDALEYIQAGASAIQIGSAVYYRGVEVFSHICKEINEWLQNHHQHSLKNLVGVAHE